MAGICANTKAYVQGPMRTAIYHGRSLTYHLGTTHVPSPSMGNSDCMEATASIPSGVPINPATTESSITRQFMNSNYKEVEFATGQDLDPI